MGGVFDVFSGGGSSGYSDIQAQLQKAMEEMRNDYAQGRGALAPWQQAGQGQIPAYEKAVGEMANPFDWMDQIAGHYTQSQTAKNNINAITQAMNNAAAASGMAGTPAVQQALAGKVNDIVNADQDSYFQKIYNLRNQFLNGSNNLMGYGFNAANGINNNYMNEGNAMAGLYGDMGNAQYGQRQANAGGWGNVISAGANLAGMFA